VRHCGQCREIFFRHADELVFLFVADDFDPVILEQPELDFTFGKQAHELEKFFRRDGAGAFLFHLGVARGADAELEVGGGDVELVALGFNQQVGQNRDRRFAFDDTLRGAEFVQQRRFGYAEFHRLVILACGCGCAHCLRGPGDGRRLLMDCNAVAVLNSLPYFTRF